MVEIRAMIGVGGSRQKCVQGLYGQGLVVKGKNLLPQFPGKSAFTGLYKCPNCGNANHFSYHYLSQIDDLTTQRKCTHCGKSAELRQYKVWVRSFKPAT